MSVSVTKIKPGCCIRTPARPAGRPVIRQPGLSPNIRKPGIGVNIRPIRPLVRPGG